MAGFALFFFLAFFVIESQARLDIPIIDSSHHQAQEWGYDDGHSDTNGEEFVLSHLLKPGDVIFDVGANRGMWSLVSLQIEPRIHLYSFEPLPKVFPTLKSNVGSQAEVFNLAFSNQRGMGTFHALDGADSEGSGFFRRPVIANRNHCSYHIIQVDLETIDHFCKCHNIHKIDYLKIDTEGGELRVLQGAKNMLFDHHIAALQFEYGGCYPDAKITLKEVMQLLTQAGYAIFRISSHGIIHIDKWEDSLESYRYANYFGSVNSGHDLMQIKDP